MTPLSKAIILFLVIYLKLLSGEDFTDDLASINQNRPVWVTSDSINLYTTPKVYAKISGEIYYGTKIYIQEEITDFYLVKIFDDAEKKYIDGWVWKKDVIEENNIFSVSIDQDQNISNNTDNKESVVKTGSKKIGFRRSNINKQDKSIFSSNWNREQKSIDVLITEKQMTIISLYKKYKVQDKMLSGQFTLKFDLSSDGKTKKVRIAEATWSNVKLGNNLNKEIEDKVKSWVFPPDNHTDPDQRRDKPVSVPYIF